MTVPPEKSVSIALDLLFIMRHLYPAADLGRKYKGLLIGDLEIDAFSELVSKWAPIVLMPLQIDLSRDCRRKDTTKAKVLYIALTEHRQRLNKEISARNLNIPYAEKLIVDATSNREQLLNLYDDVFSKQKDEIEVQNGE